MNSRKNSLFNKICAVVLTAIHLVTIGPVKDALAFTASSPSYKLISGAPTQGGKDRSAVSNKIFQDNIGEPCAGKAQSTSYILNSGFIPTIQANPPVLNKIIPEQKWDKNASLPNVFDLDDYFTSPDGYPLTYTVRGNNKITVSIDPNTNIVSLSQEQYWAGNEAVIFTAKDTQGESTDSNMVPLLVADVQNAPAITDVKTEPQADQDKKETALIKITVTAKDLDDDDLAFSYKDDRTGNLFTPASPKKVSPGVWSSEASWQTDYNSAGDVNVTITVTDTTSKSSSRVELIHIQNVNRPPVLNPISAKYFKEGRTDAINPSATDPDGDPLTFTYTFKESVNETINAAGQWSPGYDKGQVDPYVVTVKAFDKMDFSAPQDVSIYVENTNRLPTAAITLDKDVIYPNEPVVVTLTIDDPDCLTDNQLLNFTLKKSNLSGGNDVILSESNKKGPYTVSRVLTFSDYGDYKVSADVSDGTEIVSLIKAIRVENKNLNRDAIVPLMGDFNGDCLTDLGYHNSDTGEWVVSTSNGSDFSAPQTWLKDFGTTRDWWPMGGDFDGDGKTDIAIYKNIYNAGESQLQIRLSNGSSFYATSIDLKVDFASFAWQPFTGNFNGDRYTDFGLYNKDTGEVKIALCLGASFSAFSTWLTGAGTDYIVLGGDFNGDSLTDICLFKKSTGEFKVFFSNTKAFVDGTTWITGFATDKDATTSDFNNDGLTDIGCWDKTATTWYYAISTGAKFVDKGIWLSGFGSSTDNSATTGDFDGNGITDSAAFNRDNLLKHWTVKLSDGKPADLLTDIDNGIGGRTNITYTYASKSENNQLPFPVYVAESISSTDTLPVGSPQETYSQTFSYSGGYYDSTEREFRGFGTVTVTDPITNNYTKTFFYQGKSGQDGALKGQIDKIIAYDGLSKRISEAKNEYEVKKSGPEDKFLGFPAMVKQAMTVWEDGETNALSTENDYTYDNIGNVLKEENKGDISVTGDEKSTETIYNLPYADGFNRPSSVYLKDENDDVVSHKSFEYDDKGNVKTDTIYISNPITDDTEEVSAEYDYDSFGNVVKTTNALGNSVTTEYESTFNAFPKKVTNALGHTVEYEYDPKFGVVTKVTDPNGSSASTKYDTYARPLEVKNALDEVTTTYSYPDFNTKITTQNNLTKTEYIDGLGRKYKAVSSGEDGAKQRNICVETFFNNRGLTDRESLPHYVDEDVTQIAYVRYKYDIRGRVKETISDFAPSEAKPTSDYVASVNDACATINYLEPLYTETFDPLGHKKGIRKDIFGNVISVTEFTKLEADDKSTSTFYEYDVQNNLIKVTDRKGNVSQIFYDSVGRKLKMIDPDMGIWTYDYDLLGNLIKQTDAKGQVIEFQYDALNRLTTKSLRAAASGASTASLRGARAQALGDEAISNVTYLYDDTNKDNCIGRLSKVTDSSGSTEFFYDKLGREIKSVKGLSPKGTVPEQIYTVLREYDTFDRLTKLTYPDGEAVSYSYDVNSGLLESLRGAPAKPGDEAISYVKDITYNAKGQIKVIKYGNNTQTDYTYGQDLRLSNIATSLRGAGGSGSGDEAISYYQNLNYIFDKNGNITKLTDNLNTDGHKTRDYTYDDFDRLIEAANSPDPKGGYTTFTYKYDSIGNMTDKSDIGVMTYGLNAGPHAVTGAGGYTYKYDVNGNMTQGKNKAMEYDIENRLAKVDELGTITTFVYDGDGGRVSKSSLRAAEGGEAISTTYIGSLYEIDSDGKTTKHIFAGSNRICSVSLRGAGVPASGGEAISYYHTDHLGSSNVITDKDGNKAQTCEYTPYGTTARNEQAQGTVPVKHLFTGKELDATGLYFYGARYYDPEIGRFITADTIVQSPYDPQSLNRYSYCRNNPLNYIDPTGHSWWKNIFTAIGIAIAGIALTIVSGGALAPLVGTYWAGIATGAFAGATIGGSFAAATGGNIGMGLLTGFVGGAVFAGLAPGLGALSNGIFRGITIGGAGPLTSGAAMASNFTAGFLGGAASGAAVAGISGADVGQTALMGGVIAGGFSLGRDAALLMRAKMVDQSRLDPRNSSGKSVGFDGDNFKLGGGRYDPVHPNGNPSPLGGAQGGVGQIFGARYNPGSLGDRIVETYAGPHDYLNSWGYDLFGNLKNQSGFEGFLGATLNPLNVVIATPIAVSSAVPRAAYAAPAIVYGQHHENENR